jgi:hypothetical protein
MSNQMKKSAVTPFCKFCEGAGESKEVYTSHWQFSQQKNGVLTCPKLLKYKCKLCSSHGHIEKRCNKPTTKREERLEQFCRFCCNAKNPDFLNHNQFDKDGFVNCPVLLDIECQKCGGKGHTKRYCPEVQPKTVLISQPVSNEPKKSDNKFGCLTVEDVDEEVDTIQIGSMNLYPTLSDKQGTVNTIMVGWTAAVKGRKIKSTSPPARAPPEPKNVVPIPAPPTRPVPQPPSSSESSHNTSENEEDASVYIAPTQSTSWDEW